MDLLRKANYQTAALAALIAAAVLVVCVWFAMKINQSIIGPIKNIQHTMDRIGKGDMTARCDFRSNNELELIRDELNRMIEEIDAAFRRNEEKQRQLLLAEDNVLKAQIKPHFINNVLESIHWMIKLGESNAACDALRNLGKMMTERMSYYNSSKESFREGLEFAKKYIGIQKLCYPDKLHVRYAIDEAVTSVMVPTFLLQPIVENAIIHGLQPKLGAGTLTSCAARMDGGVSIKVEDDGVGIAADVLESLLQPGNGSGIGLYNVHRRLQLSYGDAYGLRIESEPEKGTRVSIRIPQNQEGA